MINCENGDNIIHVSKWAVTTQKYNKIYKMFLHSNTSKIHKEISLLKLDTGMDVKLFFDPESHHWVSESDFLELYDLFDGGSAVETAIKLKSIVRKWEENSLYRNAVTNEWQTTDVPWYCGLLEQYIPDSGNKAAFLHQTSAEHFIHGDFTLSNVKKKLSGEIIVFDFENATIGPLKWDETTLVFSAVEEGKYAIAKQLFNYFSCSAVMLDTIAAIRLAQSRRKGQNEAKRTLAYQHVLDYYTK